MTINISDSIPKKAPIWQRIKLIFRVILMRAATAPIIRWQKDIHRAIQIMTKLFSLGAPASVPDEIVVDIITKIIRSKAISRSQYCLRRTLILYSLMRHRYPDIMVNIGMNLEKPKVSGHCWLTLNGSPFFPDLLREDKEVFSHYMGEKNKVIFWCK